LHKHIKFNNKLAEEQYGFRNNSSTEIALYEYNLINNILKALNNNMWIGGIFCDLTEVFDYVNHTILLSKLEFYGTTNRANNLIKSYLSDRYQRTITPKIAFHTVEKLNKESHRVPFLGHCFFFYISLIYRA
jgi:hypothetical protein